MIYCQAENLFRKCFFFSFMFDFLKVNKAINTQLTAFPRLCLPKHHFRLCLLRKDPCIRLTIGMQAIVSQRMHDDFSRYFWNQAFHNGMEIRLFACFSVNHYYLKTRIINHPANFRHMSRSGERLPFAMFKLFWCLVLYFLFFNLIPWQLFTLISEPKRIVTVLKNLSKYLGFFYLLYILFCLKNCFQSEVSNIKCITDLVFWDTTPLQPEILLNYPDSSWQTSLLWVCLIHFFNAVKITSRWPFRKAFLNWHVWYLSIKNHARTIWLISSWLHRLWNNFFLNTKAVKYHIWTY